MLYSSTVNRNSRETEIHPTPSVRRCRVRPLWVTGRDWRPSQKLPSVSRPKGLCLTCIKFHFLSSPQMWSPGMPELGTSGITHYNEDSAPRALFVSLGREPFWNVIINCSKELFRAEAVEFRIARWPRCERTRSSFSRSRRLPACSMDLHRTDGTKRSFCSPTAMVCEPARLDQSTSEADFWSSN